MKKLLGLILLGLIFASFTLNNGLDDVITGIKAGSAAIVSKHFDNTIEISLNGKSNSYSKSQGEAVLRDFFANNTVKTFTVLHQGDAGNSQYCIGTLVTNKGSYRTKVNLKQKGDKQMLQEIKFEN
jgi:hypothetical protein